MSNSKIFITEDVYMACMSLTYTTNRIDYVAFIIGEKISDKDNIYSIGFLLYISDIPSCDQRNPNNCRILFENASNTAALIGSRCNQSLKVVGLFHPHLHTFSTEPTSRDVGVFEKFTENEPHLFLLIASSSTDSKKQIHSSSIQAYRLEKGKVQSVNFTIIPSGRKVFFDKIFALAQIYHMLKRREVDEYERLERHRSEESDLFMQRLLSHRVFERYSYHVHRFVYPAFHILMQDKEIMDSLHEYYSKLKSKSVNGGKKE